LKLRGVINCSSLTPYPSWRRIVDNPFITNSNLPLTRSRAHLNFDSDLILIMVRCTDFIKLFQQIISRDQKHEISKEEIHYYDLDMKVMKLGGNKWMVWLN